MKPLHRLNIIPALPEPLAPLWEFSYNLWWSWNRETIRTLHQIDPETWVDSERDPLRFLAALQPAQLETLAADQQFTGRIEHIIAQFNAIGRIRRGSAKPMARAGYRSLTSRPNLA